MAWCCMWCLECFNEKSNLTRHVNGKHQEASFNCKKCSFTANRIDNVRRHENGKHKKDNYSCSECSYFSDRKDNLTRHKKTHHCYYIGGWGGRGLLCNQTEVINRGTYLKLISLSPDFIECTPHNECCSTLPFCRQ